MKILILILALGLSKQDTVNKAFQKISVKTEQINRQAKYHTTEDVYNVLTKAVVTLNESHELSRGLLLKSDNLQDSLRDTKSYLRVVVGNQNRLEREVLESRDSESKLYIVNKFIDSLPLAFGGIALLFLITILFKEHLLEESIQ